MAASDRAMTNFMSADAEVSAASCACAEPLTTKLARGSVWNVAEAARSALKSWAQLAWGVVPGRNLIPSVLFGGGRHILERLPEVSGRFQGAPAVFGLGTRVEGNELKTMRALLLQACGNPLRPF